jgi:UDP-N-acetylmuramoylalanine--D-glutamate ligase
VHADINEYVSAKENITKHQNSDDILIYNQSNQYAKNIASQSVAHLLGYPNNESAHVYQNNFYYGEQIICSVSSLGIVGKFNYENACAAIDAIWVITNDISAIKEGLTSFKGLPHRLQLIRELAGVEYYDDSIATIPGATIAALKAFDKPKVIILGGSSKGSDFSGLGKELAVQDVKVILIGAEAENIANSCRAAGYNGFKIMENVSMKDVVDKAQSFAEPGSVVLLSPACASFGLFKNYKDRGEQFTEAVNNL